MLTTYLPILKNMKSHAGFTLIELMSVIVVIAILGTLALPGYRNSVLKAGRSEGKGALIDAMSRQEQFFLDNKTYTTTIGSGGLNISATTEGGKYTLSVDAATTACPITTCYALTATPTGSQDDDTGCANLTLNSDGQKSASGTNPTDCW